MIKSKILIAVCCIALFVCSCNSKDNTQERKNIDTSEVGTDYSPATLQNNKEMSDEAKQSVPGMTGDSVKTDKAEKSEKAGEKPAH